MALHVDLIDAGRLAADPDAARSVGLAPAARAYLEPLVRHGVAGFLANGEGIEVALLAVSGKAVPVAVASADAIGAAGRRASMLSPYRHYLLYPIHEIARGSAFWTSGRLRTALLPLDLVLRVGRIDRAVFLNHWLLTAQPRLPLDRAELAAATSFLAARFPDAAVVVQSVVPALGRGDAEAVRACGYRPVLSRVVHLLDPRAGAHRRRSNFKPDRRLLERARGDVIDDARELIGHAPVLARLYRDLYIGKHAALNPCYTEAFFRLALGSGLFEGRAWRGPGAAEPYAFTLRLADGDSVCWSAAGYDQRAARERGLYRLIMADDVADIEARGLVLNWGGGAGGFKGLRGAAPAAEFEAVFDRHLPPHRRLPWAALRLMRAVKRPPVAVDDAAPPGPRPTARAESCRARGV